MLVIYFMYTLKHCYTFCNNFQIITTQFINTQIQQPARIYFQTIKDLRLSNAQWWLITCMNAANYNEKYEQINSIIKKIIKSCDLGEKLKVHTIKNSCLQFHSQAMIFVTEINNNRNHVLRAISGPRLDNLLSQRGLINAVGCVANVLFGICNDADAEYFYNMIEGLERSKVETSQILESQTNIMNSMVLVINDSLIEI